MRTLPILLGLVLLAAGCLEADNEGDAPETPGPGTDDGDAPEPQGPAAVALRTLDEGDHSGYENPGRLVFTDNETWGAFWDEHRGPVIAGPDAALSTPPEVDFSKERVLAAMMGQKGSGCYAIRAANATTDGGVTTIEITSHTPPPGMACTAVVTHPYHIVALPADGTTLSFEERTVAGPPASE